jgi:enamine deaminase RidA (YjgF/YER057c/UK114 family)
MKMMNPNRILATLLVMAAAGASAQQPTVPPVAAASTTAAPAPQPSSSGSAADAATPTPGEAVIGAEGFDPLKARSKVECAWPKASPVASKVRYVNAEELFDTAAYSAAAIVPGGSKLVLISGQIPIGRTFELLGEDLFQQTQGALRNLCHAMRAAGVSGDDIVRLRVSYVHQNPGDPFLISEQIHAFLGRERMPATTMVGVTYIIAEGIRVQVDAEAVVK